MTPVRFKDGDRVFVRRAHPPGHVRAPYYIRGKEGMIDRLCGIFPNPEERAYGRDGRMAPLYFVRFPQHELWEEYDGPDSDTLVIEIYEHWLEPISGH